MTKIKLKDIYKFILNVLPISPSGDLVVEVKEGKKVILTPSGKSGVVGRTGGILKIKTKGVRYENSLRSEAEKRIAKGSRK